MGIITKEKFLSKEWIIAYSFILIGTFTMALGFVFFINPYKFAPGGVYGIAIVIHHVTKPLVEGFLPHGLPIGLTALSMDIPLTIIGSRILGPRFGVKTVVGFVSTAVFVDVLQNLWGDKPLVQDDPLLSAIFGGVLVGIGLGLVFRSRATSGGTDIVASILEKYTKLPIGQLLMYVDASIALLTLVAFHDWSIPLYSMIIIFITGRVIDITLEGFDYNKAVIIISDHHEKIREIILHEIDRGGTIIPARGMYHNRDKKIIFTVLGRREVEFLKNSISKVDPEAFITIVEAKEILGKGFKSLIPSEHMR